MGVCSGFSKGYKKLCAYCGHAQELHGPFISIEDFVKNEIEKLKKFEKAMSATTKTNAPEWQERFQDFIEEL